jgi:hypothetical protein
LFTRRGCWQANIREKKKYFLRHIKRIKEDR